MSIKMTLLTLSSGQCESPSGCISVTTELLITFQISVEGGIIIIVCSVPVLQPLLDRLFKRNPFSSRGYSNSRRHPFSSRGTNAATFDPTHYSRPQPTNTKDDFDFDFKFTRPMNAGRSSVPMRSSAVVSRQSTYGVNGEAAPAPSNHQTVGDSEAGGILMTKVVMVSFSDKDSL